MTKRMGTKMSERVLVAIMFVTWLTAVFGSYMYSQHEKTQRLLACYEYAKTHDNVKCEESKE